MSKPWLIFCLVCLGIFGAVNLYWQATVSRAGVMSFDIAGDTIVVAGYGVQKSTKAPPTGIATVMVDAFPVDDFPYQQLCRQVITAAPEVPFLGDVKIDRLSIVLMAQYRKFLVVNMTETRGRTFDVSSGVCTSGASMGAAA